ncbi:alpha/beta hydrolase [Rhodococcus sp. D2-41]|uniref:Alpha/beta hydrolase n=1 Tax=Speluncibacter jeojiensis TaxID=2710754 RepID=A0A9X4LZH5_9ACTN|nr:alpha/beta hydrolase [Rhodococcus sp. D2-41]MDG3011911.1 alpha/beta hydrolase [Rhodococcus sp. D2-41]MDG3013362.1 alpha/beta hydrolase [Corynebacteriales bacterium D3-21]
MQRVRRYPIVLTALLIVGLVGAGCARQTDGQAEAGSSPAASTSAGKLPQSSAPAPSSAPAVPAGLERFYDQKLDWQPCSAFVTTGDSPDQFANPLLSCARVTVPIDYDKPDGPTAKVAIMKLAATGSKIGSLLVNPGGPGGSGLQLVAGSLGQTVSNAELGKRFDLVGFDPRGVGSSTPAVHCLTDAEADHQRTLPDVDMSPAGIAKIEKERKTYAARCTKRSGDELLAHVGTREVAKDMDVIRAVLGDPKLNYLGFSYGTRLGTVYAEQFPTHVRAMVLDGALDPAQDPVQEQIAQGAGFQSAFDGFAADCAKASDCALGDDPAQANKKFRALVDPLIAHPARTTDPRGLSYADAITGVMQALYSPQLWPALRTGLDELAQDRGDTLLQLADLYEGRDDDGKYSNSTDAFNAIRCVDDPPQKDRAVAGKADMAYRKAAPFLDDGRGTGNAPLDLCAFWPVPNTLSPRQVNAPGLAPTVVVSTTHDPATPYQAGVDLAKALGGSLITFEGTQHTATLDGNSCVDDAVTKYLVDLTTPAAGLTCGR